MNFEWAVLIQTFGTRTASGKWSINSKILNNLYQTYHHQLSILYCISKCTFRVLWKRLIRYTSTEYEGYFIHYKVLVNMLTCLYLILYICPGYHVYSAIVASKCHMWHTKCSTYMYYMYHEVFQWEKWLI